MTAKAMTDGQLGGVRSLVQIGEDIGEFAPALLATVDALRAEVEGLREMKPRAHQHMTLQESYEKMVEIFGWVGEAHIAMSRKMGANVQGSTLAQRVGSLVAACEQAERERDEAKSAHKSLLCEIATIFGEIPPKSGASLNERAILHMGAAMGAVERERDEALAAVEAMEGHLVPEADLDYALGLIAEARSYMHPVDGVSTPLDHLCLRIDALLKTDSEDDGCITRTVTDDADATREDACSSPSTNEHTDSQGETSPERCRTAGAGSQETRCGGESTNTDEGAGTGDNGGAGGEPEHALAAEGNTTRETASQPSQGPAAPSPSTDCGTCDGSGDVETGEHDRSVPPNPYVEDCPDCTHEGSPEARTHRPSGKASAAAQPRGEPSPSSQDAERRAFFEWATQTPEGRIATEGLLFIPALGGGWTEGDTQRAYLCWHYGRTLSRAARDKELLDLLRECKRRFREYEMGVEEWPAPQHHRDFMTRMDAALGGSDAE